MRHIRDPVSGRCLVCEKNNIVHHMSGDRPDSPNSTASWDSKEKKLIYLNPHPSSSPPGSAPRLVQRNYSLDSGITIGSARSTSKILVETSPQMSQSRPPSVVDVGPKRPPSPPKIWYDNPPKYRPMSSPRQPTYRQYEQYPVEYYRRPYSSRVDPQYRKDVSGRYTDGYHNTSSLRRRCCAALITILVLLALAGLAVGLYFGITAALANATKNSPQNKVVNNLPGGYYVNGVYVVPVTTKPSDTWLVYGQDIPCNPNNNNVGVIPNYPNCNQVTTSIVLANWLTLNPVVPPVPVVAASGAPRGPLAVESAGRFAAWMAHVGVVAVAVFLL